MTTTGLFYRDAGVWVGTGIVTTGNFVLGTTKPLDPNSGAGVIRPAPTTTSTTVSTVTSIATSGGTYVSVNFTHDLTVSGDDNDFIDCLYNGALTVSGDSNSLSNCIAKGNAAATNHWLVYTSPGTNTYIEYSNIFPTTPTDGGNAIGERNYHTYRCKVWNTVDGWSNYAANGTTNVNVLVEGCYCPRLAQFRPDALNSRPETHCDGSQLQGGIGGTYSGNNIIAANSTDAGTQPPYATQVNMSCIMMTPNTGHITNVQLLDNWFDYGIIAVNGTAMGAGDSVTLKRNKFGSHITAPNTTRPIGLDAAAANTCPTSGPDANVWEVSFGSFHAGDPVPIFFS